MKKLLAILLSVAMLMSVAPAAFAAEDVEVITSVDYSTKVITVSYTNPASFPRYVNLYMASENDVDGDVFTDFEKSVRMDMKLVKANESFTFTFKLGADIKDGNYYFFAAPSGYGSEEDYAKSDVVCMVSVATEKDVVLPYINSADETDSAKKVFEKLDEVFLFNETSAPQWKNEIINAIRTDDFNSAFQNIQQVAEAWVYADVLYEAKITEEDDDAAKKLELLITESGCDKTNADYKNFKQAFLAEFQKQIVINDALSKADVNKCYKVAGAFVAINNRDTEGKAKAIEEYQKELGISDDLLAQMKAKTIVAVIRNMGDFTVASSSDLTTKINAVLPTIGAPQDYKPQGGGSFGGGGGGGSSVAIEPSFEEQLNKPISTFNDVPNTHWAAQSVGYLANAGVISGTGDGSFAPDRTVTREEFVKMVVGAFGITGAKDIAFGDIAKDNWAYNYIAIAVNNGIVNGVSEDAFGMGAKITRQDMAVIIARVAALKGIDLGNGSASFTDAANIDGYAKDAVELLAGAKVINGYEDGSFKPQGSLTRAEAAKVIYGIVAR